MKTKHTPGPWHVGHTSNTEEGKNEFIDIDSKKGSIARAWHPNVFSGTQKETEANAKLIAAAPELLEALKAIKDNIKELAIDNIVKVGILGLTQKAIEKAT